MELKKRNFRYFETVLETGVSVDTGAEMIVPDLLPDIERIIDTGGQTCLKEKNIREDRLEMVGIIRVGVLYKPEGMNVLNKLDVAIPFNHVFDGRFSDDSVSVGNVRLLSVESSAINPRKVQVSVSVYIEASVYSPKELEICDDVIGNFEILKTTWPVCVPVAVNDKSFTVTEELEISPNRPQIDDILKTDVILSGNDVKVIGNKVIFKGTAQMRILYQGKDTLSLAEHDIGFSQIIEMDGLEEGSNVDMVFELSGMELEIHTIGTSPEPRCIGITLYIEAQAIAYMERRIETVADLYCVEKKVIPEYTYTSLSTLTDKISRRQNVRETLEVGSDVQQVIDSRVYIWPAVIASDGSVSCEVNIKILYCSEENEYGLCERRLQVSCPDGEIGGKVKVVLGGEIMAAPTSDGLEVRFVIDFEMLNKNNMRLMMLSGIKEDETEEINERPSVVLRRSKNGESLWDIAKKYRSTRRDLALVNHLEDIELMPDGKLLLIPKKLVRKQ